MQGLKQKHIQNSVWMSVLCYLSLKLSIKHEVHVFSKDICDSGLYSTEGLREKLTIYNLTTQFFNVLNYIKQELMNGFYYW